MPVVPMETNAATESITTPLPTIVVSDMAGRGIMTFELKECRGNKLKIIESAATNISMWVNCVVPLSESQFIVFDQDNNLFIFQKSLYPTSIEEKLRLVLIGSFCIGEEVQSASFGSLRVLQGQTEQEGNLKENEEAKEQARTERKKKSYLTEKTSSLQQD